MKQHKISAVFYLNDCKETMQPLTDHRPIAALPFNGRYRIVDFLLSTINYANIESVAMFISGSGRSIYDHVRSAEEWDLNSNIRGGLFTFSQQNWKQEFHKHVDTDKDFYEDLRIFLHKSYDEYIVVMSGEVIHTLDIKDLADKHVAMGGDITLPYSIVDTKHEGFVLEGDNIVALDDSVGYKPMNMDIYFMHKDILTEILDKASADKVTLPINETILRYLPEYNLKAYEYNGFARKVCDTQAFFDANMDVLNQDNYELLFNSEVPIITRARSGPPAYYGAHANVSNAQLATSSKVHGKVENTIIFRKVNVDQDSVIKNSIIMTGAKIGKNTHLEYVLLDKDVTIGDNVTLKGSKGHVLVVPKGKVIKSGDV